MICAVTGGARPSDGSSSSSSRGPGDQRPAEREHLPLAAGELVAGRVRRRASGSNSS